MKKRKVSKLITGLLVLILLAGLFPTGKGSNLGEVKAAITLKNPKIVADSSMEAGQKVTWDCIWFGTYPQSEVTTGTIYNTLKNARGWDANNDIVINGTKYCRLKGNHTRYYTDNNHYNWNNDYSTYHYFKYDPIKWRVLEVSNGHAFLLADKVIDVRAYNPNSAEVKWETSCMRSWLNGMGPAFNQESNDYTKGNFINTAFSTNESKNILTTTQAGTSDKLFLLSDSQIYTEKAKKYGFAMDYGICDEARRSKCSSYAFAMGCWKTTETPYKGNVQWWLRSPGMSENYAVEVYAYGWVSYLGNNVDRSYDGVRPALHLNLSSSNLYSYAGTVCSDGTINNNTGNNNSNSANNNTGNTNNNKNNTKPSTKTTASKKPTKRALLPVEKMTGSLKSVKSPAKSNLAITWKKLSKVTGYHVQFSAKSNFKKGTIERKFKQKVTKTKVRPLKSKKKYYVRMRPYTKSGSKTYYGKWSKVKSVKIK